MKFHLLILFLIFLAGESLFGLNNDSPQLILSPEVKPDNRDMIYGLYSVGWAEEGYFSFIVYYNDESSTYFSFNIQNLKTDQSEFQFEIDTERESLEPEEVWNDYKDYFMTELSNYQIEMNHGEVFTFPMVYNDDIYNADSELDAKDDPSEEFYWIDSVKLTVTSADLGDKTIFTDNDPIFLGLSVSGAVVSPYGDRMAVILLEAYPDLEYVPFHWKPRIVGCHLSRGFK